VISVIVPAYNEEGLISECLDSVLDQSIDKEIYEIIVIDNNSTDLTATITRDKQVRVEKELKKGYVYAVQKGIEVSQGEIIAFTDADCRVPKDWLKVILDDFSNSPEIVAVGGKASYYDLDPILDKIFRGFVYFINALPGNNMAIKREAIKQMGGIDPRVNLSLDFWFTKNLRRIGKLRIDKKLVVRASGRRFRHSFFANIQYLINVISILITSKPMFFDFPDIREGSG
jgi:glycosyltransferase involved in cell wall biosynthesis